MQEVMRKCHEIATEHGFWEDEPLDPAATLPYRAMKIALMHSELSECLEGIRKPGPDQHCPNFTQEEVELADCLIRVFDYAHHYNLRLVEATVAKMIYNDSRPHKHGKAF